MRTVTGFDDYELIDADSGERLERWKNIVLIRPDPQIIWSGERKDSRWKTANAVYHRSQSGGGRWEVLKPVPDVWSVNYEGLTFRLKPMGFKHTGLFPEQAVNWTLARQLIEKENRQLSVLNLFAYTGAATLACLKAGAKVTHVDASKGMVQWAKENAKLSGVDGEDVREFAVGVSALIVIREGDGVVFEAVAEGQQSGGLLDIGAGGGDIEAYGLADNGIAFSCGNEDA